MKCERCDVDNDFFKMTTMTYKIVIGFCKIGKIKRTVCDDCHLVYSKLDAKAIRLMDNPMLGKLVVIVT